MFALFVLWLACKDLGVPLGEYAKYVVYRPVIGAILPLSALLVFRETMGFGGWPQLVAGGVAFVALFSTTWYLFVYRGDEHVTLPRLRNGSGPAESRPENPA